ncbi:MAG: ABC-F family ATP-binding cassette domain-containing protein [Bacteroidota bacterium]
MNYLSIEKISKAYADKVLFEDLSFGIEQGQKVALVGINGSGKSTLLKILAGLISPDTGQVSRRKGIKMAFLPQVPKFSPSQTVQEVIFEADNPSLNAVKEYEALLNIPSPSDEQLAKIQQLSEKIDSLNAWEIEIQITQILGKLDIHDMEQMLGQMSGGQQKRVALAKALIEEPDLIIMDEPTNHLDLESIEWLEKFLSTSKQSLVLVTHDRYFLDCITTEIIELDQGKLFHYEGNYAHFLAKKTEREAQYEKELTKARSLYKTELEWLRRSPKARGTKSKSRIDAAGELKEKTKDTRDQSLLQLQVKGRRIGGKVLEVKKLRKSYGDNLIIEDFSYTFSKKEKIGVIGPNGVGKSTFLNLLMELEPPDSGKIRKGETIVYGYYTQSGWSFKDNQRVIEVVTEAAESVELSKNQRLSAAKLLEHFLFPRYMHHYMVETLSGGEKRRLHLLRILMTNPNFLILDEPTNDLDLITLRKLEEFLADFEGCLMIVSHDRYFMDRLVDHTFIFEGKGKIKDFPGSYSQYRSAREAAEIKAAEKAVPQVENTAPTTSTKVRIENTEKRKLSYKEKREYESLEGEIDEMEGRKKELEALINSGETDYQKLGEWTSELESLNESLETKTNRWLELAEIAGDL